MKKLIWALWSVLITVINAPVTILIIIIAHVSCGVCKYEYNLNPIALIVTVKRFPRWMNKLLTEGLAGVGAGSVVLIISKPGRTGNRKLLWHELGHIRQNIILTSYVFLILYFSCLFYYDKYKDNPFEKDADAYMNKKRI